MATIPGSIQFTGFIAPTDDTDTYAVFKTEWGSGDKTVSNTSERDAIKDDRREWGMLCYVTGENKTYQLIYNYASTTIGDNSNWREVGLLDAKTWNSYLIRIDGSNYGIYANLSDVSFDLRNASNDTLIKYELNNDVVTYRDLTLRGIDNVSTNASILGMGSATSLGAGRFKPVFSFGDAVVQGATTWATGIGHPGFNKVGFLANGFLEAYVGVGDVYFGRIDSTTAPGGTLTEFDNYIRIYTEISINSLTYNGTMQFAGNAHITKNEGIVIGDLDTINRSLAPAGWKRFVNNNLSNTWEFRYGTGDDSGYVQLPTTAGNTDILFYIHQTNGSFGLKNYDADINTDTISAVTGTTWGSFYLRAGDLHRLYNNTDRKITPVFKSVAPDADDDITFGYTIDSLWIDTTNQLIYHCSDNSDGAAVWGIVANYNTGGGASAGGSANSVQYNNGGSLDGNSDFMYNGTNVVFGNEIQLNNGLNSGGSAAKNINLYKTTPVTGNILGYINYSDNVIGSEQIYASMAGVLKDDTGSSEQASLAFAVVTDGNLTITSTANKYIALNDTTANAAGAIGIYKPLKFANTSTNNEIEIRDGQADALSITDGTDDFIVFNTTDEKISIGKEVDITDQILTAGSGVAIDTDLLYFVDADDGNTIKTDSIADVLALGDRNTEQIDIFIEEPEVKSYVLRGIPKYGATVEGISIKAATATGTQSIDVEINGTDVTSLTSLDVTTSWVTTASTGAKTLTKDSTTSALTLNITSIGTALTDLQVSIEILRT